MPNSSSNVINDKRQKILEAAEILISADGFHGLSMHKLAQQAGVAAGTIYRYFDDKDHLIAEVRLQVSQRIANAVQANLDDAMPLKLQFRTMWFNIWHLATTQCSALHNRLQYDSFPHTNWAQVRDLEKKMFYRVETMFNTGKQLGVFKPLDNTILACLSLEACLTLARKHALGLYQLDNSALEAALDACWDAITQSS